MVIARAGRQTSLAKSPALSAVNWSRCWTPAVNIRAVHDGVMFMHSQRLPLIRQLIDSGEVGQLRRMTSQFSFQGGPEFERGNIRTDSRLEPHGCLGDLGWYCIRMFHCLRAGYMPCEVRGRMLYSLKGDHSPEMVPGEFAGTLVYPDGVTAEFYCSFRTSHQQWLYVSGSTGYLRVDDFVLPYRGAELAVSAGHDPFMIDSKCFAWKSAAAPVHEYDAARTAQEVRMIQASHLRRCPVRNPQWMDWADNTQLIMDACLESPGSVRPVAL